MHFEQVSLSKSHSRSVMLFTIGIDRLTQHDRMDTDRVSAQTIAIDHRSWTLRTGRISIFSGKPSHFTTFGLFSRKQGARKWALFPTHEQDLPRMISMYLTCELTVGVDTPQAHISDISCLWILLFSWDLDKHRRRSLPLSWTPDRDDMVGSRSCSLQRPIINSSESRLVSS